ncbi:unknown [Prevotella sp. CAG:5226]|nr:unknown [Prevotella sp. CAG:5226]
MCYQCSLLDEGYKITIFIKRFFTEYLYLGSTFLVEIK